MTNAITKIEISERASGEFWIVATYADGRDTVFGNVRKERGAKAMLTRRAKQFGLTVNGRVAS